MSGYVHLVAAFTLKEKYCFFSFKNNLLEKNFPSLLDLIVQCPSLCLGIHCSAGWVVGCRDSEGTVHTAWERSVTCTVDSHEQSWSWWPSMLQMCNFLFLMKSKLTFAATHLSVKAAETPMLSWTALLEWCSSGNKQRITPWYSDTLQSLFFLAWEPF